MQNTDEPDRLLDVTDLSVSAPSRDRRRELVSGISFGVRRQEVLIVLGESGSGKTILSRALTRLFPVSSALTIEGSVRFEGHQLLDLSEAALAPIRRHRIRYVFQEPMQSLNPLARIIQQMRLASDNSSEHDALLHTTLKRVGLEHSDEVLNLFPHELSIGMAQRVCIAMAVLPSPSLLVADEPTSAVDASLRRRILDLLISIQQSSTMSLILITHDLDVARSYGERIIVMYEGRLVESAGQREFFDAPFHPYSRMLVNAQQKNHTLAPPSGPAPGSAIIERPRQGCSFSSRCPRAEEKCKAVDPHMEQLPGGREVRCFFWR